jgi:hypothetical protein
VLVGVGVFVGVTVLVGVGVGVLQTNSIKFTSKIFARFDPSIFEIDSHKTPFILTRFDIIYYIINTQTRKINDLYIIKIIQ